MEITKEWLEEWFEHFNSSYFSQALPRPKLLLSRSRTRLGSMSCRSVLTWKGRRNTDFVIRVSNYYDLSEREFQHVLLHEMIHYFIAFKQLKDTSSHGRLFRSMMNHLNEQYGWEIAVRYKPRVRPLKPKEQKQEKCLCLILKMKNGDRFVTVVNPRYALILERQLQQLNAVENYLWFISSNSYFSNFSKVRSLKGRKIDVAKYDQLVEENTTTLHVLDLFNRMKENS